jgi:hypothetical protein
LTKISSNESTNPLASSSSFDYLFSNEQQMPSSSSNDVFSSSTTSSQQSFTSVRDMNKNFYNLLQSNSQEAPFQSSTHPLPTILHDMLKSSPPPTASLPLPLAPPPPLPPPQSSSICNPNENQFNSGDAFVHDDGDGCGCGCVGAGDRCNIVFLRLTGVDSAYSSLSKSPSLSSQSPSPSHCDSELDQMISAKLSKQLKTMDRSSPLFRRMVVAIMRHQMNKSKGGHERRKVLSTPASAPSSSSSPSSSSTSPSTNLLFNQLSSVPSTVTSPMDLELTGNSHNALPTSTFDLDVEAILDFERTTFGDCSFDIHDLPNL